MPTPIPKQQARALLMYSTQECDNKIVGECGCDYKCGVAYLQAEVHVDSRVLPLVQECHPAGRHPEQDHGLLQLAAPHLTQQFQQEEDVADKKVIDCGHGCTSFVDNMASWYFALVAGCSVRILPCSSPQTVGSAAHSSLSQPVAAV